MRQSGQVLGEPGEAVDARLGSADPAASMSLLTSLLANPLDAGYEHYRGGLGSRRARTAGKAGVLLVAIALGFGSVVAISSLRHPAGDVKADLRTQASSRSREVADLRDEVQSLGSQIERFTHAGSTQDGDGVQDISVAASPVSGPGIVVTLSDRSGPGKGSGAVRDQDLAMVVNAMWSAGADAVSVNGQRIGPDTFVRKAGSAILVNVTPVSSPYEVAAIGDANALSIALVRGATGDYLSAAQSVTGMTVSTKSVDTPSMTGLSPAIAQYATPLSTHSEGDPQ